MIKVKRVYDSFEPEDGYRILVDRLWPRGIRKDKLMVDQWLKEVAPSTELRKWFNHEPEKWDEFKKQYTLELKTSATVKSLIEILTIHTDTTLLYAAKDTVHNHAVVLQKFITDKLK